MPTTASSRTNQAAQWILVAYLAIMVAFGWQKIGGAYDSEFGGHPDEGAHYVTGLFVHDALATLPKCVTQHSLQPLAPFKGKEGEFYQHYPKVALGVWPPGFYAVQSAWMFLFGASRFSILLLMATLAGGIATLLYRAVKTEFGAWPAGVAAFLWLCGPLVRESYGMVMAEMLSTLTMFGATLVWGRFLDERKWRDALWFGVLAGAAIMTKGTGMALVLMCALSILFARRWRILATPATWVSAVVVGIIAGPWTWIYRGEGTRVGGWADNSGGLSWGFTRDALPAYGETLALGVGIAVGGFALVGWVGRGFRDGARARLWSSLVALILGIYILVEALLPEGGHVPALGVGLVAAGLLLVGLLGKGFREGERSGRWASVIALVLGVYLFQCTLPVGIEARHLVSVTPALVMLAIAGLQVLARARLVRVEGPEQVRREKLWVVLLIILTLPIQAATLWKKGYSGFAPVAQYLLENAAPNSRILVSSDARGEGMFISEIAMHDHRPNLFIERASNSLVDASSKKWNGRDLRERFLEDEQLLTYLTSGQIDYIVVDDTVMDNRRSSYHDQIKRVVVENAASNATGRNFWKIEDYPITREDEAVSPPIHLYRVTKFR